MLCVSTSFLSGSVCSVCKLSEFLELGGVLASQLPRKRDNDTKVPIEIFNILSFLMVLVSISELGVREKALRETQGGHGLDVH